MRRLPCAFLLVVTALGCARSKPVPDVDDDVRGAGILPGAPPPHEAPAPLPTSRSGALAMFVDASTLDRLSGAFARAGMSYCDQAYFAGVEGTGGRNADGSAVHGYLEACGKLPVPVQRCLGLLYSGAHDDECDRLAKGLDPPTRAEFERLQRIRSTGR